MIHRARDIAVPEALVSTLQDLFNILVEVMILLFVFFFLCGCMSVVFRKVVQPEWEKFTYPTLSMLHEINERLAILVNNSFY